MTLSQTTQLITMIKRSGFDIKHNDDTFDKFRKISEKQYKFLYALIFNNNKDKLKEVLNQLNICYTQQNK